MSRQNGSVQQSRDMSQNWTAAIKVMQFVCNVTPLSQPSVDFNAPGYIMAETARLAETRNADLIVRAARGDLEALLQYGVR